MISDIDNCETKQAVVAVDLDQPIWLIKEYEEPYQKPYSSQEKLNTHLRSFLEHDAIHPPLSEVPQL